MKKRILTIVSALCACSLAFSFAACGGGDNNDKGNDNNDITQGKYEEATAEEINSALANVTPETVLGDTSAADFKFGLDVSADVNFSMTNSSSFSQQSGEFEVSAGYKMLIAKEGETFVDKGAGNVTVSMNSSYTYNDPDFGTTSGTTTGSMTADIYQDSAIVYIDATAKTKDDDYPEYTDEAKIKVNALQVVGSMMSSVVGYSADSATSMNLATVVNMLNEMGATTSLNITNGVKLKISVDESFVNNVLVAMAGIPADSVTELVSFTKCNVDLYIAIDTNGALTALSLVADVEATVKPSETYTTAFKLKGSVSVKVDSTVNPVVPAGLADNAEYMDVTSNVISMIGGSSSSGGSDSEGTIDVMGLTFVYSGIVTDTEYSDEQMKLLIGAFSDIELTFAADGKFYYNGKENGTWVQDGSLILIDGESAIDMNVIGNNVELSTPGTGITVIFAPKA